MKKILLALILVFFSINIFANEMAEEALVSEDRDGIELSTYFTNRYALGDMAKFAAADLGAGFAVEYDFPFLPVMGVSGRAGVVGVIPKSPRPSGWTAVSFTGGVFANLPLTDFLTFRPELAYGAIINMLKIDGIKNVFVDQLIQVAVSFRIAPELFKKSGFSIEVAPVYSLQTEKNDVLNYLGFRAGVNYRFM